RNRLTGTSVGAERAATIGSGITACSLHRCQALLQQHGKSVMGLLDNVLGSSVPGGSLAKPLGIALLAYLASRSGNNPAGSGGGLGGLLSGGLRGPLARGFGGGAPAGGGPAAPPRGQGQTPGTGSRGLGGVLATFPPHRRRRG